MAQKVRDANQVQSKRQVRRDVFINQSVKVIVNELVNKKVQSQSKSKCISEIVLKLTGYLSQIELPTYFTFLEYACNKCELHPLFLVIISRKSLNLIYYLNSINIAKQVKLYITLSPIIISPSEIGRITFQRPVYRGQTLLQNSQELQINQFYQQISRSYKSHTCVLMQTTLSQNKKINTFKLLYNQGGDENGVLSKLRESQQENQLVECYENER